jgi:large subunit ribosomal protein L9
MKVVLLQDISGVGKKWEIKDVKGGYGRNYLLARNLAVLATPGAVKDVELKKEQEAKKKAARRDLLGKSLESLQGSVFVVERKANEKGHLYDAFDAKEISELLKEKLENEIPADCIELEKPIKETGKHKITVSSGDLKASFEIEINPPTLKFLVRG